MADAPRRSLRNGTHGYGLVTKTLHWAMVLAILSQFVIGYTMDAGESGRGRGRGRGEGSGRGRGQGGGYDPFGSDDLLTTHVVLGSAILVLAVIRVAWRLTTGLPPWAETLTHGERTFAHWTERALYVLMFAIPLTGLWLILADDDDARTPHVVSHIVFFVVIVLHVGLVLKHQLLDRDRLLHRML
ncbi:MAG TPA: cytochrome b/b6 domain-containing protein [Ilumatobacter sp.]|nr:cytochrome b/b6 domain-containing protein [Ilumatobacter sp.]